MAKSRAPKRHELKICPDCGGYMKASGSVDVNQAMYKRHWQDNSFRRGFGGRELRVFICEKCGHRDTFQTDPLHYIKEDPT